MTLLALPAQVALVDETGRISADELAKAAGALNEQVSRDFAPIWHVRASVVAVPNPSPGMWAIRIKDQLDEPGALGYHTDDHNQPVAYVEGGDGWQTTASHELLEMLADPWGNRMHGGRIPAGLEDRYKELGLKHRTTHVNYLLEVCDPPEAHAYDIGDVMVSDFIRPAWYHASTWGTYSYAGGCTAPRQVAGGGYASFCVGTEWYQATNWGKLDLADLGRFDRSSWSSLREFTDHYARVRRAEASSR